ncbi:MAG: hypothetical protein JWP37_3988 [Mucilaginibacter sp.]|nr:hypothetical protein [Mucilaginibacter sp.]
MQPVPAVAARVSLYNYFLILLINFDSTDDLNKSA